MRIQRYLLAALVMAVIGGFAVSIGAKAPEPSHEAVAMRDGVSLATDVYLPEGEGPFPAILMRSTYGRTYDTSDFLKKGYAVVIQDIRGMGGSEGEKYIFRPDGWRHDQQDGRDTVEWLRAQEWSNGRIVSHGGSALTMTQMLLAPSTPHLSGQILEVGPGNFYREVFYNGGAFRQSLVEGWLPMVGMEHLIDVYRAHPFEDGFWSDYNSTARANEITAPGFFVTGWHDIFQQGAIDAFLSREYQGGEGARGRNALIIKWSPHGPDTTEDYTWKENRFDLKVSQVRDRFLDAWLAGNETQLADIPKVQYYVIGADTEGAPGNEWRSADSWPPYPTVDQAWLLQPAFGLAPGALPGDEDSASFRYDPANPVPTRGGANLMPGLGFGPDDQRSVAEGREDILRFRSAPLEGPLEVTGRVTVRLFVSSDAPDTDFTAKLLDIYPEGDDRELLVLDNIRRVATREGFELPAPPLQGPGHVVELEIDLWSIAWIFHTGHRIGLDISSSNAPRYAPNNNTYDRYLDRDATAIPAVNTIHFGGVYPSALVLPVRAEDTVE